MLSIVVTPKALEDIFGIALHVGQHNPGVGLRFVDAAEQTFQMLCFTPYIGQRVLPGIPAMNSFRVRTIVGFRNYIVYYRPREETLEIIRVVYGGQDQEPLIDEMSSDL